MQDDTSNISTIGTEAGPKPPAHTIKAPAEETGKRVIPDPFSRTGLRQAIKNGDITPEEAIEQAFPSPFTHISQISVEALKIEPLPTGFRTLDSHLVLKKDRPELVVVGAGTSHGKSAFMLQVAANVARHSPVFVFSLEMDERDIKARLLAPRINAPLSRIMAGEVIGPRLRQAEEEFSKMNLYLCTNGRREIEGIRSAAFDSAKRIGNPGLVVVDYLQLTRGPSKNTRTAEIAEILGILKEMAKTLKCPVMIGSQLNRECERRGKQIQMQKGVGDYQPIKSDLMDSGSIEHDADVIMFISRQYVYDRTRPNEADFIIAKNRNGKLCNEVFQFTGEQCIFLEGEAKPDTGGYPI